jgi:hypothetical protein
MTSPSRMSSAQTISASANAASTPPPLQARNFTTDAKRSIRSVTMASNSAALLGTSR